MFRFEHMKTPAWAKDNKDIYFLVINEDGEHYGYIGLQNIDLSVGSCNNLCYKTRKKFRGEGKSKYYLKEFLAWCPLNIDQYKASVNRDNIASIKMLEFCGFTRSSVKRNNPDPKIDILIEEIECLNKAIKSSTGDITKAVNNMEKKTTKLKELDKLMLAKSKEPEYFSYKLRRFDY